MEIAPQSAIHSLSITGGLRFSADILTVEGPMVRTPTLQQHLPRV